MLRHCQFLAVFDVQFVNSSILLCATTNPGIEKAFDFFSIFQSVFLILSKEIFQISNIAPFSVLIFSTMIVRFLNTFFIFTIYAMLLLLRFSLTTCFFVVVIIFITGVRCRHHPHSRPCSLQIEVRKLLEVCQE